MLTRYDTTASEFASQFTEFLAKPRGGGADVRDVVSEIVDDVRLRGGVAVADATARFDRLTLDPTLLTSDNVNLHAMAATCDAKVKAAIDFAADRITAYHSRQTPTDMQFTDSLGVELGWRWTAIEAVGLYVPGGAAAYPSSLLMNAIPAQIAGVKRRVLVSPCPNGILNAGLAYAALKCGIEEFYPIGGAQAIAALAYGAGRLEPVSKIVGPGNAYVAEAKRQVFGHVGIDTIAGPSEILVIADDSANPAWVAADLLSQAEHDVNAQALLICFNDQFANAVDAAITEQLQTLSTANRAQQALEAFGACVVVQSQEQAWEVANQIAAEHVEIMVANPDAYVNAIHNAGAIFIGDYTAEALGDYVTGSNHVLPTARAAKFASGLGVYDFIKRTSIQKVSKAAFATLATHAQILAQSEGLPAHAQAIRIRQNHD